MTIAAYIGLGSNLGDSAETLRDAMAELGRLPGSRLIRRSSLYRSTAIANTAQPDYRNAVAEIATELAPPDLLAALLEIERRHGRVRSVRDAPRTLDLDLLLYGARIIDEAGLTVPHPRMHERAFVLAPLCEIAPDCAIPGRGLARECLSRLQGQSISLEES